MENSCIEIGSGKTTLRFRVILYLLLALAFLLGCHAYNGLLVVQAEAQAYAAEMDYLWAWKHFHQSDVELLEYLRRGQLHIYREPEPSLVVRPNLRRGA